MALERAVYLGPRIRRLRRSLGLTQGAMGADLEISASYIALLESNQRPLTADMLLRIARTYKVDVAELAGAGGADLGERLRGVLRDPLFADLEIPPLHGTDVAANFPAITEAFLRLYATYRDEQRALADRANGPSGGDAFADPVSETRAFLASRANHFPALEDLGESLAKAAREAGGLGQWIEQRHDLRIRLMPATAMGGSIRRYDPHHQAIFLDERLDRASRNFQLALQLVYLEARDLLIALANDGRPCSEDGWRLTHRALGAYGAAAIVMPYREFHAATVKRHYDIETLARVFDTSFEQVAHRLTTLQRPGEAGVPFFFLRLDSAGNVSKRLDGAGFPFARHGGGCPLWNVHDAFAAPGSVLTQWLEMPDGERFFSIARTVAAGGGAHDSTPVRRAVALCCAAADAQQLIYAREAPGKPTPMPIGINCRLCPRDACPARAVPPLGRALLPDDYHRGEAPFGFADESSVE